MRGYIFNNNEYNNLNALALGYIEDFDLAIKDVKENYKKLLSFILMVKVKCKNFVYLYKL